MRLVEHRENPSKWIQHFKEQSMGVRHPNHNGYIFLSNQTGKGPSYRPSPVKLVSPVQQGIDQAKAEISRERKGIKRKSTASGYQSKRKRARGKTSASHAKRSRTRGSLKKRTKPVSKRTKKKAGDIFSK